MSLLISDRIKSSLSDHCLRYVLSVENNQAASEASDWLKPSRLADPLDEYAATVGPGLGSTRASYIGQPQSQPQPQAAGGRQQVCSERSTGAAGSNAGNPAGRNDKDSVRTAFTAHPNRNSNGRRCTICE